MKREMYYVTMILTAGLLLFSTVTLAKGNIPDDDDPVTEKDKHHGEEDFPTMIQSFLNHTTGILTVTFWEDIDDISILIYKDGSLVEWEEEGDVYGSNSFFFDMSLSGQGSYLVVIKSENMIIYTMSHEY